MEKQTKKDTTVADNTAAELEALKQENSELSKKLAETDELNSNLKEELSESNKKAERLAAENKQLDNTVDGLMKKISEKELQQKLGADTLQYNGKVYRITAPKFSWKKKQVTTEDLKKDKELQKELIEGPYQILVEVESN